MADLAEKSGNNQQRLLEKLKKPKTQRGKRILKERGPQLVENSKFSLVLAGRNCSNQVALLLRDLYALRKPAASFLKLRSEEIRPLEDETQIERFTRKSNAGLFLSGSHSKKRPVNLVFGRMFDSNLLDLAEFRVVAHKLACEFSSTHGITLGTKPCIAVNVPSLKQILCSHASRTFLLTSFMAKTLTKSDWLEWNI